jgi:hypothetical protein
LRLARRTATVAGTASEESRTPGQSEVLRPKRLFDLSLSAANGPSLNAAHANRYRPRQESNLRAIASKFKTLDVHPFAISRRLPMPELGDAKDELPGSVAIVALANINDIAESDVIHETRRRCLETTTTAPSRLQHGPGEPHARHRPVLVEVACLRRVFVALASDPVVDIV